LAKGFYKRTRKVLKIWKKVFYKKIGKNFLQRFGENFFNKNLAKVLKQKHKNNFLKTFFTQLFLKTNIFVTSKKVLYKHFLHKKEKKKKKILASLSSGRSCRPGTAQPPQPQRSAARRGEPASSLPLPAARRSSHGAAYAPPLPARGSSLGPVVAPRGRRIPGGARKGTPPCSEVAGITASRAHTELD
jgi:hypothetical protein